MQNKEDFFLTESSCIEVAGSRNSISPSYKEEENLEILTTEIKDIDIEDEGEFKDNIVQHILINQYPSKKMMSLYYLGGVIGYCSVLNEFAMSKFIFDSNSEALDTLSIEVFNVANPSNLAIICITIPLTMINLFDSFSGISPFTDSAKFLKLKNTGGELIHDNNLTNHTTSPVKLFLIRIIPCTTAIITFICGSFGSWLGINSVLKNYPIMNYSLGLISSPLGICYSFLLSWNDILNSIDDFHKSKNSAPAKLFIYSKSTFLLATSRLLVNLLYRSSIYFFIAKRALNEIFKIEKGGDLLPIIPFTTAVVVTVFTRLGPITLNYIKPFQTSDGTYDFKRISDTSRLQVINNMGKLDYLRIALRSVPVGFIRSIAVFYLLYSLVSTLFDNGNLFAKVIIAALGLFLGLILFMHVIYVERKHFINEMAAKDLKQSQMTLGSSQIQILPRVVASFFNVGVQSCRTLLEVASFISMLGGIMGRPTAATVGLLVGAESGWVNFFYMQPKYENRVNEIISGFSRIKNVKFPFFFRNNFQRLNSDNQDIRLSELRLSN